MEVLTLLYDPTKMVQPQRSVFATFLLITALVPTSIAQLSQQPRPLGAPVTNLSVKAQLLYNAIHLRVDWTPPTNSSVPRGYVLPAGYIVHVAVESTDDPYCTEKTNPRDEIIIQDPSSSSVFIPPLHVAQHDLRMAIRQECTYHVEIQPDPASNITVSKTYLVPECVETMCRCHSENISVPSSFRKEVTHNGDINVTWVMDVENNTAHVKLYKELLPGKPPVLGIVWEQQVNTSSVLVPRRWLNSNHTNVLEVRTITKLGCQGLTAKITLNDPRRKEKPQTQDGPKVGLIATLLVISLVLAVGGVIVGVLSRRCGVLSRRLQPIQQWRGIYKTVSMESRLSRARQERNILYVEKEIEEAKQRGEVDKFEVSYSRLQLGRQIGKGAFGCVFLAKAHAIADTPGFMMVAVKKLKKYASADEVQEFLSEIAMLKRVGHHPNIVTLLGCCTLQEPYCMLMEYVPCGDLLRYLRRLRAKYELCTTRYVDLQLGSTSDSESMYIQPDTQYTLSSGRPSIAETECTLLSWDVGGQKLECVLDSQELHNFALQIAQGMAHLESNQITHRDLAARNVLIDESKTLKISDFGLSRSGIYVNTRRNKVPLRWLSVEAMREHLYSNKSDVWAFGVVLWEIGTLGGFPYPTVEDLNLLKFLLDGRRLDKPDNCSPELYCIMLKCWSHSPDDRPTFAELIPKLCSLVGCNQAYVDFKSLPSQYVLPPLQLLSEEAPNNLSCGKHNYANDKL